MHVNCIAATCPSVEHRRTILAPSSDPPFWNPSTSGHAHALRIRPKADQAACNHSLARGLDAEAWLSIPQLSASGAP